MALQYGIVGGMACRARGMCSPHCSYVPCNTGKVSGHSREIYMLDGMRNIRRGEGDGGADGDGDGCCFRWIPLAG